MIKPNLRSTHRWTMENSVPDIATDWPWTSTEALSHHLSSMDRNTRSSEQGSAGCHVLFLCLCAGAARSEAYLLGFTPPLRTLCFLGTVRGVRFLPCFCLGGCGRFIVHWWTQWLSVSRSWWRGTLHFVTENRQLYIWQTTQCKYGNQ